MTKGYKEIFSVENLSDNGSYHLHYVKLSLLSLIINVFAKFNQVLFSMNTFIRGIKFRWSFNLRFHFRVLYFFELTFWGRQNLFLCVH